eukprot:1157752-Pelagomonas_calceolata.AAC.1
MTRSLPQGQPQTRACQFDTMGVAPSRTGCQPDNLRGMESLAGVGDLGPWQRNLAGPVQHW